MLQVDRFKSSCLTALAASAMFVVGGAQVVNGAIITYAPPTIVGTSVSYPSVSESSNSTLPLYGAPTISGNDLLFRNLNFSASSISATPAVSFVDGQLNFTVVSNTNSFIQSLNLSEFGDYNVSATPANPSAINFVKVYPQALQITVLAENGVALTTPLVDNTSVVIALSPSNGDYQTGVDPSTGSWNGLAAANLAAIFGSTQITSVSISFDNQLLAESQTGGIATISKKGVTIDPVLRSVPEPATVSLLGLAGVSLLRRRRQVA